MTQFPFFSRLSHFQTITAECNVETSYDYVFKYTDTIKIKFVSWINWTVSIFQQIFPIVSYDQVKLKICIYVDVSIMKVKFIYNNSQLNRFKLATS